MTLYIKDLSVTYRNGQHDLLALERVCLNLKPGRITALVGESGSGKTTLGKAVMGLLPESAERLGHIRLNETELTGLNETELNKVRWSQVAMVFQNGAANFNPVHPVIDQVAEPLMIQGQVKEKSARERAARALEDMRLPKAKAGCFPHELSGGEIQRALLAMALVMDPGVLILDEPTSALDTVTKTFLTTVIQDLATKGKAILLITHDLDLADRLAHDIAVLYLGQIMETLPGRTLFLSPRHPYTLGLGRSFPGMGNPRDLGGIKGDAFYRFTHRHTRDDEGGHPQSHHRHAGTLHEDSHGPSDGCLFHPRCPQAVEACFTEDVMLTGEENHQVRCLRGGIADRLELKGVSKSYEGIPALCTTDLTLKSGEIFCLVGETGSGKTTLSMIGAGVTSPDTGQRVFEGRDMDTWQKQDYRSLARHIGVIYQNPAEAVSHRLPVFDIVAEPLVIQGLSSDDQEIRDRVIQALTDVHLSVEPSFLKRYSGELNMGALQRLCIARALVLGPALIVADEPTSALDPSVQAKILKLLMNLQVEKGLTMLFVTHDIGVARKIADRIGVMQQGKVVEMGPAVQVLKNPSHPYTRHLMGV